MVRIIPVSFRKIRPKLELRQNDPVSIKADLYLLLIYFSAQPMDLAVSVSPLANPRLKIVVRSDQPDNSMRLFGWLVLHAEPIEALVDPFPDLDSSQIHTRLMRTGQGVEALKELDRQWVQATP